MTRDNCNTCNRKVKNDNKLVCCICNKTLHLTTESTEFETNTIEVLIKLNDNLVPICNSCIPEKQDFLSKLESKLETKIDENLKKFQNETNNQMKKLQLQMKTLTDKIEKSYNIIINVQSEVINVKNDTKIYKQSLGKVKLGKSVSIPEKTTLGVYKRRITESGSSSAYERLHADLAEVEKFLEHFNVEDKKTYSSA